MHRLLCLPYHGRQLGPALHLQEPVLKPFNLIGGVLLLHYVLLIVIEGHRLVMDVKEDTELSIVINQEGHSHAREAMGVALFKGSPPYLYNMAVNDNLWYQDSFTGKIEAGTYGVVAQTFAPGVEVPFSITVIGEAHIEFKDTVGTAIASGNEQKQ